jgi:N-methylhydantoinase A/oxoprolinase/acetone carboxylase beta subunit
VIPPSVRLGVDIGGTFTDVALEVGELRYTAKILTTPRAPEEGVLAAVRQVTASAGVEPGAVGLIIHGTTLATNALIERKGARTALLTTEGFRATRTASSSTTSISTCRRRWCRAGCGCRCASGSTHRGAC